MLLEELPGVPPVGGDIIPRNGSTVQHTAGDASLAVRFYQYAVDGTVHIEIRFPGDDRTVVDREAHDGDKQRFAAHWNAYKNQSDQFAGQTRLEMVAWIDPGSASEMKRHGIHTIEQLAGLTDDTIGQSKMMGLTVFRTKATEHVKNSQASSELDGLRARIAQLEQNAAKPRGPGRPRKDATA